MRHHAGPVVHVEVEQFTGNAPERAAVAALEERTMRPFPECLAGVLPPHEIGGRREPFEVSGVTFDSREVMPGDLFIAMPGTIHDGHKFVAGAFEAGAGGAIVSQPVDGPHVLVEDRQALDVVACGLHSGSR
mgnify:CR=1 FL=1